MAPRRFLAPTETLTVRPELGTAGLGPQGSLAGAEAAAAQGFGALAAQAGGIADRQAVAQGEMAGALAGADGAGVLPEPGSLYGDAYRDAWLRTYAAKLDTDLFDKGFAIYEANKDSPAALDAAFVKLRQDMQPDLLPDPIARQTFDLKFSRMTLGYRHDAVRRADARVRDAERGAAVTAITAASANMERQGYALGLDPEGLKATETEARNFRNMVDRAVESNAISPSNAEAVKRQFEADRAAAHIKGEFERLAPTDRPAFVTGLAEEYKAGKGLFKGMDLGAFEKLQGELERGLRSDAVAANKGTIALDTRIKRTQKLFEEGYSPAASEWSALDAAAASVPGGPEAVAALKADDALFQRWRNMSPGAVEAELSTARAAAATSGTDQVGARKLAAGERYLANMRTELGRDPLGWAERTGAASAPLIDFSAPGAVDAMQDRAAAAEAVAQHYGIRPVYLRPEEKQALQLAAGLGGDAMTGMLAQIAQGFGTRAPRVLAEVSKDAPVLAHVGGLLAAGGSERAAADAAAAATLKRDPAYKPPKFKDAVMQEEADAVYGNAFLLVPETARAAEATARAIFETRVARGSFTPAMADSYSKDGFRRALNEAVGAVYDRDGRQYGGIGAHDPAGWFNRAYPVVVPSAIRADRFTAVVDAIRDADLPKGAPSAGQIQAGHLVAVGDGRYRVAAGDPSGDDPRWLTTATGAPFVLDVKALEGVLRPRVPTAYAGSGR